MPRTLRLQIPKPKSQTPKPNRQCPLGIWDLGWKLGIFTFDFSDARPVVRRTRHHEQQVGEAVQVDEHGLDGLRTERDDAPFGATADRSGQMQQRAARRRRRAG